VAATVEKLLQTFRTCNITRVVAEAAIARVASPEIQFSFIALAFSYVQCAYTNKIVADVVLQ
jgi:hypothetical protein